MDITENCPGCGAVIDETHLLNCDVARCILHGGQLFMCEHDEWVADTWTGFWPGELEAIGFGFWCYWGPDYGQRGWVTCEENHPGARPDLNRLYMETTWDAENQKRVLRSVGI